MNFRAAIERAGGDPAKLKELVGDLAPLMRDTLVAFNYCLLCAARSADSLHQPRIRAQPRFRWRRRAIANLAAHRNLRHRLAINGGGRLVGSLAALPYTLAEAEQNFLIPAQTQALIWGDLVPQMIISAKIPRWWNATPAQLHFVGLHLRYGHELMAESAFDPALRTQVLAALGTVASPARTFTVGHCSKRAKSRMPSKL